MTINRYHRSGLTILILIGLTVIGVAMGTSLAQQPQGSWLSIEASFSPQEVPTGEGFLTALTLRNEGTEEATVGEITVELPDGVDYVGQAFGSAIANSAESSSSQLRWAGPFPVPAAAELELRFWATAAEQASPGQHSVRVAALNEDGSLVSSEGLLTLVPGSVDENPPAQPSAVEEIAAQPSAVLVNKTAEPEEVDPGEENVLYTVTFSNTGGSPVTLDTIKDLLPAGFGYVGLHVDSQIDQEPADQIEPEIVWQGSFVVPAGATKTLKYWAHVPSGMPPGPSPYTNEVRASYDGTPVGPAYADVWVGQIPPPAPQDVAASDGTFSDKVRVTWSAVAEATYYEVYRATSLGGAKTKVGTPTATLYDDTGASLGITYYYWVKACEGVYCSDVSAHDTGYREGYWVHMPFVVHSVPATTLPFVDTFAQLSPDWVPFSTPTGPYADQWIWGPAGYYWYDPAAGGHVWNGFALSMYLGAGAQDWTDYQVVTKLKVRDDRMGGIWFRGTYQGGQLGGYYVHIQPKDSSVYLWRLPIGSTSPSDRKLLTNNDYGPGILEKEWYHLKVVVQGNRIRAWLKGAGEPESAYRPMLDWTDSTWAKGTVGFSAYLASTMYDDIAVTEYP